MEVPLAVFDKVRLPENQWLTAEVEGTGDEMILTLNVHCNTRDSRDPFGRIIEIVHPTQVPEDVLDGGVAGWLAFIRHCLITLAVHEVDEWFAYDGELVNDPHGLAYYEDLVPSEARRG